MLPDRDTIIYEKPVVGKTLANVLTKDEQERLSAIPKKMTESLSTAYGYKQSISSVTLNHLARRLIRDEQFLKAHPENKEMLEKRINNHKEMIIEAVRNNIDNPFLSMIDCSTVDLSTDEYKEETVMEEEDIMEEVDGI